MLELYQAEGCPYSEKVRRALTDLGISYVAHNPRLHGGEVKNELVHEHLLAIGGEDQIPFLVDTDAGRAIYDSDDIVEYVTETYG